MDTIGAMERLHKEDHMIMMQFMASLIHERAQHMTLHQAPPQQHTTQPAYQRGSFHYQTPPTLKKEQLEDPNVTKCVDLLKQYVIKYTLIDMITSIGN